MPKKSSPEAVVAWQANDCLTLGLSSDGTQSIGQPRAFWLTTEWQF